MYPNVESNPDRYCRLFPPSKLGDAARADALAALGEAMMDPGGLVSDDRPEYLADSGFTYFGQFIDHDLTEMDPIPGGPVSDVANYLLNRQTPRLDLNHLYGSGPPNDALYETDNVRLRVGGRNAAGRSFDVRIDPASNRPAVADSRSGENLIIRQMVALFARLHNAAVEQWRPKIKDAVELFEQARLQTAWQFQYLVVDDYLRRMLDPWVFEKVFGRGNYAFEWKGAFSIPVEFAVGAMRFGHSMVRVNYLFGNERDLLLHDILERALQPGPLEDEWEITWGFFFQGGGGSTFTTTSRPIDTLVSPALHSLPSSLLQLFTVAQASLPPSGNAFRLPVRTLLRGESMLLTYGDVAANALQTKPLTQDELTQERRGAHIPHAPILKQGALLGEMPLWYYILKESEIRWNGSRLGPVGSHILAETISAALRYDPNSLYFNSAPRESLSWRTRQRLAQPPLWRIAGQECHIYSLRDLFALAAKLPID